MKNKDNVTKPNPYLVPIIIMLVLGVIIFLPAGSFKYWQGWIFWIGFSSITFFIAAYFTKKSPELLSRRMKNKEKESNKKAPSLFKLYYIGYILPGLDFRFHWSNVPLWVVIISNVIAFSGYIFIVLVFKENSFASTVVQIENEQYVITTGPYSIVRHPMYLGLVLISLFTPLALGSYFAIIPMLFIIPLTVYRIKGEEEVLTKGLKGYEDYCSKTRYRLIPFIW